MFLVQRQVDNALALKLDALYRGLRLHVCICMHAMDRGGTYPDKRTKELMLVVYSVIRCANAANVHAHSHAWVSVCAPAVYNP